MKCLLPLFLAFSMGHGQTPSSSAPFEEGPTVFMGRVTWPEMMVLEKIEGIPPIREKGVISRTKVRGTALKLGQVYPVAVDVRFVRPTHGPTLELGATGFVPCEVHLDPFPKMDYQVGDRVRIWGTVKPLRAGKDALSLAPHIAPTQQWPLYPLVGRVFALPITVRPAMDWGYAASLGGISMALREGALALLLGALAIFCVLWFKARMRGVRIVTWLSGWLVAAFLGQIGVWFLLDKLFVSMPERLFTLFNVFNLPVIISVTIALIGAWILSRRVQIH